LALGYRVFLYKAIDPRTPSLIDDVNHRSNKYPTVVPLYVNAVFASLLSRCPVTCRRVGEKNLPALAPPSAASSQLSLTYRLNGRTERYIITQTITGPREWSSISWAAVISHPSMSSHSRGAWENGRYCSATTQDGDRKYFSLYVKVVSYHETRQFKEIII